MIKNTILIVDDNKANLQLLENILTEKGYRVLVSVNGQMALTIASLEKPDLVLLDVMMPEMDGYEVCNRLKQDPDMLSIPVIFLTAKSDSADEARGFEVGAVDYISKPFSVPIVLSRVQTQLRLRKANLILEDQNAYLENKVRERTEELEEKNAVLESLIRQKTFLIRELHHRVMNNLQFLAGILALQIQYMDDNPVAEQILEEYENRVQSLAILHQEFYHSRDFVNLNPKSYFLKISENYLDEFDLKPESFQFDWGTLPEKININIAIPLGLVVNELLYHFFSIFARLQISCGQLAFEYLEKQDEKILTIKITASDYRDSWEHADERDYRFNILEVLLSQLEGRIAIARKDQYLYRIDFKKTAGVNYSEFQ